MRTNRRLCEVTCAALLSWATPLPQSLPSCHDPAQVLRALHEALLHEPGGSLLTPPRFQRLLPALVAQLGAEPDMGAHPALAAALEADAAAAPEPALPSLPAPPGAAEDGVGLPAGSGSEQGDHAYGRAAVAAVVQLAVAAGSDDLWKPLNHQARSFGTAA